MKSAKKWYEYRKGLVAPLAILFTVSALCLHFGYLNKYEFYDQRYWEGIASYLVGLLVVPITLLMLSIVLRAMESLENTKKWSPIVAQQVVISVVSVLCLVVMYSKGYGFSDWQFWVALVLAVLTVAMSAVPAGGVWSTIKHRRNK